MKPQVWLVLEVHCYLSEPNQASVWVSGRALSPDKTLEEDVARKLIGPLPYAEGVRVIETLRAELSAAGVDVVLESTADD